MMKTICVHLAFVLLTNNRSSTLEITNLDLVDFEKYVFVELFVKQKPSNFTIRASISKNKHVSMTI